MACSRGMMSSCRFTGGTSFPRIRGTPMRLDPRARTGHSVLCGATNRLIASYSQMDDWRQPIPEEEQERGLWDYDPPKRPPSDDSPKRIRSWKLSPIRFYLQSVYIGLGMLPTALFWISGLKGHAALTALFFVVVATGGRLWRMFGFYLYVY